VKAFGRLCWSVKSTHSAKNGVKREWTHGITIHLYGLGFENSCLAGLVMLSLVVCALVILVANIS
jgi:hypothetical protein